MQNLGGSYSYLTTATMWGVTTVVINFAMIFLFSRSHIPVAGLLECVKLLLTTIGLMNWAVCSDLPSAIGTRHISKRIHAGMMLTLSSR